METKHNFFLYLKHINAWIINYLVNNKFKTQIKHYILNEKDQTGKIQNKEIRP